MSKAAVVYWSGTVTYGLVALLELLKIKRMPMTLALKDAAV